MAGYQALYRKYRPQTFGELAGQDPISETLRSEVRDGRLAHAYLFTGPRGTGKTTSARLLAKALNCARGPTPDPCPEAGPDPECPQCQAIRKGTHLDVVEIDAASNRGIDDIRSLQERVQLAPVQGRCKVFIIDEVHMLTDPAWNALLKTLEEPPPNCVFVLATTEVHKVLATVLSRCQRFDFQRIGRNALIDRLRFVADREAIDVDAAALDVIARRAEGGLRDALSLLDQVAATTRAVTAPTVYDALGLLPADQVLALGGRIADRDAVGALELAYALLGAGHDHRSLVRELLGWARNLLLLQLAPDRADALDIPPDQAATLGDQAPRFAQADLLWAMDVLRETDQALRGSNLTTVWLEVGLLRLCDRASIPDLADLARRVADLEARGQAPAATPAPAPDSPAGRIRLPDGPTAPRATPLPAPGDPPGPARGIRPDEPVSEGGAASRAPTPPQGQEAGALEAAAEADQDVYQALYQALDRKQRSKSSAFKQYVVAARRRPDGAIEVRTRRSSFYKEGSEHRKALDEQARELFGPGTRLDVVEESAGTASLSPPATPVAGNGGARPVQSARPADGPRAPEPARPAAPSPEPPRAVDPPRGYDSGDPVKLAADIFLGKIVEPR